MSRATLTGCYDAQIGNSNQGNVVSLRTRLARQHMHKLGHITEHRDTVELKMNIKLKIVHMIDTSLV
jgi:hypothetical protein